MALGKRPSPSPQDEFRDSDRKQSKRTHHRIQYRQPGARLGAVNSQDPSIIQQQLSRALCICLFSAGFTGADSTALFYFQEIVDQYMRNFTLRVHQSMQTSRRSEPLPQDFIHALSSFEITPTDLLPELVPLIPATVTQQPILLSPSSTSKSIDFGTQSHFDEGTNLLSAKTAHRYIPKHFPNFPAEHAYRQTPVFSGREDDAMSIRELSTKEGMLAEQALRKLVAANRLGLRKRAQNRNRGTERGAQRQKTEDIWRDALAALTKDDERKTRGDDEEEDDDMETIGLGNRAWVQKGVGIGDGKGKDSEAESYDVLVNYDRVHWRRGAAASAASSSILPTEAVQGKVLPAA